MTEKYPSKKQWGPGPWQDEPDELHWVDPATGYKCRIIRCFPHSGHLNGYVAVPGTHPAQGMSYNGDTFEEHNARMAAFRAELRRTKGDIHKWRPQPDRSVFPGIGEAIEKIEVHGGLTYAGPGQNEFSKEWWFGFDCGHAFDLSPGMEALTHRLHIEQGTTKEWERRMAQFKELQAKFGQQDTYRTIDYVRTECTELARQLKALEVDCDILTQVRHKEP